MKPESGDKGRALKGGVWTTLSRFLVQLIHFAIFLVAVRVMTPAEFGLFALVAAITAILTQVSIAGWPEYIMQWADDDDRRPRQALFVAFVSGLAFALLGLSLGLVAPLFSDDPVVVALIQVLSVSVLFTSVGASFAGIMNWQDKLTAAAIAPLVGEVGQLIVAVWLLLDGHGVMALAYGRLVSSAIWCVVGFAMTRKAPLATGDRALLQEMAVFSSHVVATRLVGTLRIYAATFIVGGFMGATAVGFYRAAQRVVVVFEEIVSEPTRILAWSLFRKVHRGRGIAGFDDLARGYFRNLLYSASLLFLVIAVLAEELILVALLPSWMRLPPNCSSNTCWKKSRKTISL